MSGWRSGRGVAGGEIHDADIACEMARLTAERLMELEVGVATGAGCGNTSLDMWRGDPVFTPMIDNSLNIWQSLIAIRQDVEAASHLWANATGSATCCGLPAMALDAPQSEVMGNNQCDTLFSFRPLRQRW